MPLPRPFRRQSPPPTPGAGADPTLILCMPPSGIQLAEAGATDVVWEIARPGTWYAFLGGRVELRDEDLAQVAAVYDPAYLAAAINLDHTVWGPSHGWVRELRFEGGRLLATVGDLSEELVSSIRQRRYQRASAELKPLRLEDGSEVQYLRGIGVLGSMDPAIPGMRPIAAAAGGGPVLMIHLAAEPDPPAPAAATTTPGEEPAAPAAEPEPTPQEGDPMPNNPTPQPGAPGTPGAQPTVDPAAPTPPTQNPPASPDPNHAALAASRTEIDRELQLARQSRERTQAMEVETRVERATARVDRDLAALGGRITPAEARTLRPVLISLASAETQGTVQLAAPTAADPAATREATQYDALLASYQDRPDYLALLGSEIAADDGDAPAAVDPRSREVRQFHLASGVTDERIQELAGRYGRDAIFGASRN